MHVPGRSNRAPRRALADDATQALIDDGRAPAHARGGLLPGLRLPGRVVAPVFVTLLIGAVAGVSALTSPPTQSDAGLVGHSVRPSVAKVNRGAARAPMASASSARQTTSVAPPAPRGLQGAASAPGGVAGTASAATTSSSAASSKTTPVASPIVWPKAVTQGTKYATTGLNVRSAPSVTASLIATVAKGSTVTITQNRTDGWRQVVVDGALGWVKSDYLTSTRPATAPTTTSPKGSGGSSGSSGSSESSGGGTGSGAPCPSGSSVERGLVPNAVRVHRAVCANFPAVTSFGGVRATADAHGTGHALDCMITGDAGWALANWARAHASELGITEVIYQQRIWTTQRSGEGWRPMSDRGSVTANHFDHVHITVS